jgi:prepilin-type N-terminal cleavage/methylation domain-containing protein
MHDMRTGQRGFTMIELMVVIAIIAVLGAIAMVSYRMYIERAAAADLISAHHNIRNYVQGLGGKSADDCAALAASYERKLLSDPYARLDYGFEAVPGGFRPVLSVCATAQSDARNIPVARRAHDSFANIGVMEKGAVLSDSVVSYALRLTDGEQALCKTAPASSGPACAPTQAAASSSTPPQASTPACPAGQEMASINSGGKWQRSCAPICQSGQRRGFGSAQCVSDAPAAQAGTAAKSPQAQAAEQKLAASLGQADTIEDAINKTAAAAQGVPDADLTQSIPGKNVQCPLPQPPQGGCQDMASGNFCATLPPEATGNCNAARVCPKTLGVCQGVTPEMRRMFDASMQRIVETWFSQHPGCTEFRQTGC